MSSTLFLVSRLIFDIIKQNLCERNFLRYTHISFVFCAYFPYFEKNKVDLCDHVAVCVCVYPPLLTLECLNQSL
jgi:hypothetical protein